MHSLFLREVSIDWDAVSDYTQHIAALYPFDRLIFQNRLPFLQEKTAPQINASGGDCCCLWF